MKPIVLTVETDLAGGTTAERFDGAANGDGIAVSFFLNHTPPPAAEMVTEWIEEA
jgi:hypothetical protein